MGWEVLSMMLKSTRKTFVQALACTSLCLESNSMTLKMRQEGPHSRYLTSSKEFYGQVLKGMS